MTTKRKRHGEPDPLQIQISARVHAPDGRTIAPGVLREAIAYRIRTGKSPRGITLRIVRWRHLRGRQTWHSTQPDRAWSTLGRAITGWLAGSPTIDVDVDEVRRGR